MVGALPRRCSLLWLHLWRKSSLARRVLALCSVPSFCPILAVGHNQASPGPSAAPTAASTSTAVMSTSSTHLSTRCPWSIGLPPLRRRQTVAGSRPSASPTATLARSAGRAPPRSGTGSRSPATRSCTTCYATGARRCARPRGRAATSGSRSSPTRPSDRGFSPRASRRRSLAGYGWRACPACRWSSFSRSDQPWSGARPRMASAWPKFASTGRCATLRCRWSAAGASSRPPTVPAP
mmetsp:Transcript_18769/g.44871  ORF Transcript_18769/g.44871 Transcript_18769/m.44871 type:complete len:237 (+) Transcript_18769:221-931(+)